MVLKFKIPILLVMLSMLGCKKQVAPQKQPQSFYKSQPIAPNDVKTITEAEAKTLHKDSIYQYEYRTGTKGEYEYNYDISGHDQYGNFVSGNINTSGKQGAGILTHKNGEEIDIVTEWIDYGKLKAIDAKGNEYELQVD